MFKPFKNQGLRVPTAIRFSFLPYLNEPVGTYGAELRSGQFSSDVKNRCYKTQQRKFVTVSALSSLITMSAPLFTALPQCCLQTPYCLTNHDESAKFKTQSKKFQLRMNPLEAELRTIVSYRLICVTQRNKEIYHRSLVMAVNPTSKILSKVVNSRVGLNFLANGRKYIHVTSAVTMPVKVEKTFVFGSASYFNKLLYNYLFLKFRVETSYQVQICMKTALPPK